MFLISCFLGKICFCDVFIALVLFKVARLINRTVYQYHINGSHHSPEHRPLSYRQLNSNGITNVNRETEILSAGQFEALKQHKRRGARGSIDSGGSGVSSDTAGENSTMQQVMA